MCGKNLRRLKIEGGVKGKYDSGQRFNGFLGLPLIVSHNQSCPSKPLSPSYLLPSLDQFLVYGGLVPLKNGKLTCGCPVRAEAPDALTHNEVAGFGNLSVEALRKKIVEMHSTTEEIKNRK